MASSTSSNPADESTEDEVRRITRRWAWWASGMAILIGLAGLVFPQYRENAVSLIIGVYFVSTGIGRAATAFDAASTRGMRVIVGALGIGVVAIGVLCLNNPYRSFAMIDSLVSIGLIVDAAACAGLARLLDKGPERRTAIVTGIVSVAAAVVVFALPIETFGHLLTVSAACFITVGLITIIRLVLTRDQRERAS
ncbi:hypothetical protein GCM10027416_11270 [Okibacterium endophyticum]